MSFSYPANWTLFQHQHDIEFQGPIGAVTIMITDVPMRELEQFAQDFFTESDEYTEESRDALDEPSGYISIGNLRMEPNKLV
ncbi:MAG: hypothetical protein CM1200mP6_01550 [Anaerolineaceae bacterium]|nr:MAG: hypothetical protein CM1200mP6_01550 [Anaerolineaceae bacterium]